MLSQLDLIAYRNPGYFADVDAWQDYRRASRHGLSAAERVVVFSDHTRRELLSDALVEEERIRIVPPGLDHRTSAEPRRPPALGDGGEGVLASGFLLCLGTDFLPQEPDLRASPARGTSRASRLEGDARARGDAHTARLLA